MRKTMKNKDKDKEMEGSGNMGVTAKNNTVG
jgi:hypothetical protein